MAATLDTAQRAVDGAVGAPTSSPDEPDEHAPPRWVAALPACAALVIGLIPLTWTNHWSGAFSYDEGAYVGSAIELARGLLPYRDFAFVQPPGITILLLPIAALGRAFGAGTQDVTNVARVLTVLATALSAGLAALAVRHRGIVGMMVAGGALAAFPLAYTSFSSTLLEPYLDVLCLLGVVVLFRRGSIVSGPWRLYAGGIVFGLAIGFKIWALIPAGLGVLWTLRTGWRIAARYLAGIVTGVLVMFGPFLVASPQAFVRDVFLAQADRLNVTKVGFDRFASITGVQYLRFPIWWAWVLVALWLALLALAHLPRRPVGPGRSLDWFVSATAVVVLALLMVGHPYYPHYANILAPWVAITGGSLAARAVGNLSALRRHDSGERSRRVLTAIVLGVTLLAVVLVPVRELWSARLFDSATRSAAILSIVTKVPSSECVVSDASNMLEAANRFATGGARCPVIVDSQGVRLAALAQHGDSAATYRALASQWRDWFSRAQLVYLTHRFRLRIPWKPWLATWFHQHFRRVRLPASDEIVGWLFRRR
jgi:hypothetical protein